MQSIFRNGKYITCFKKYAEYLDENQAYRRGRELLAKFDYTEVRSRNWRGKIRFEVWVGKYERAIK